MKDKSKKRMENKTILITGSSRGIGFYTAKGLAEMGAHTIIVSHNEERCQNAVKKIQEAAGEGAARYYVADLSVQDEIRDLAEKVKTNYDHLDVLVNNVATWNASYQKTADGIEETFALNHLSYFLLTGLLIDLLKQSAPARIVNVASDAHEVVDRIHFKDIGFKEGPYRPYKTYGQSKLANIMFTYELAERLEGSGVTANVLHPGSVASKLYRKFGILEPLILFWIRLTGKSSEEGAETPIYLASAPEVDGVNGKYFVDKEQTRSSDASYDKEAWERLWDLSEEMTDFEYPV